MVRLRVSGATTVNGEIRAQGGGLIGVGPMVGGGGGGSVHLVTGTLEGSGTVHASGGHGYKSDSVPTALNETVIMLVVLALIDVVMISNLLIMVIVGGYETFVSRLNLEGHPDQPEWLSHVNASVLKVKLATAIIGISSIHLLKTFINAANYEDKVLIWQTVIHIAFLFSALAIALADRIMSASAKDDH